MSAPPKPDPEDLRQDIFNRLREVSIYLTVLAALEMTGLYPNLGIRRRARQLAQKRTDLLEMSDARICRLYPELDAWIEAELRCLPTSGSA